MMGHISLIEAETARCRVLTMNEKIVETDVAIVGAGGCGLTAALVAADHGKQVLLLERDANIGGSTAMSAGIFVAAGSRLQQENGESGTADELAADIFRLNGSQSDGPVTRALCDTSGPLMDWLVAKGVPLEHMPTYKYAGMTKSWIHSPPQRDGVVIINALLKAARQNDKIDLRRNSGVTALTTNEGSVNEGSVNGLLAVTGAGEPLNVKAQSVILAASGFGNNKLMVDRYIPDFSGAPYFGAKYATGDAIEWGQSLGAELDHMGTYQSHSSISYPKMMLVTTYLINHGAIQINRLGRRFGDETDSYAGHALAVQAQPGRVVIELFDENILQLTQANYPRFAECLAAGIVERGQTLADLARPFGLDEDALARTIESYNAAVVSGRDEFGRTQFGAPLVSPFYGINVTSALVQTLGGLRVDARARVVNAQGAPIPGLYAGGGTASGLAGEHPEGYLAGTGLLSAFGLGWIAGRHAAETLSIDVD
jgi:fumarate reductase flavoprotein subunit